MPYKNKKKAKECHDKWVKDHPEKCLEYEKKWKNKNRTRTQEIRKNIRLKHDYGITLEKYKAMYDEQGGVCAICGLPSHKALSVDHDHKTGKVRGLLCDKCNWLIGHANESIHILSSAIEYLKVYNVIF